MILALIRLAISGSRAMLSSASQQPRRIPLTRDPHNFLVIHGSFALDTLGHPHANVRGVSLPYETNVCCCF